MPYVKTILLSTAFLLGLNHTAQSAELTLTHIGNAAVRISDGSTALFSDFPYVSGAYGFDKFSYDYAAETLDNLSLITHTHTDHVDVSQIPKLNWSVIAPGEVVQQMPSVKTVPFAPEMKFKDIQITAYKTSHANLEHYTYMVQWQGKKLVFTGDTDDKNALNALPSDIDVLFITPWLYQISKKAGTLPPVKNLYIYHANQPIPESFCSPCKVLNPGDKYTIK